jgi:hypothetical protein
MFPRLSLPLIARLLFDWSSREPPDYPEFMRYLSDATVYGAHPRHQWIFGIIPGRVLYCEYPRTRHCYRSSVDPSADGCTIRASESTSRGRSRIHNRVQSRNPLAYPRVCLTPEASKVIRKVD